MSDFKTGKVVFYNRCDVRRNCMYLQALNIKKAIKILRREGIGKKIDHHLYFYMARYTWATFADNIGVSHDVISKALGHSDR